MTIKDILKFILNARTTNPIVFYGCIAAVVVLFLIFYNSIKKGRLKRKQELLEKESEGKEIIHLVNSDITRMALKNGNNLPSESVQGDQIEKAMKNHIEAKEKIGSTNKMLENDFVAISPKLNRICVTGLKDKFSATKIDGKWRIGYPDFDDLMDNYSEVTNLPEIIKYSLEARNSINDQKGQRDDHPKRQIVNPYIDGNEVEIRLIESTPDPASSEPKRIGYSPSDIYVQIEPYKYAVVKMPQKNSLIKFPRKGRSENKGYKEESFWVTLNKYFKSSFNIFNERHIPTPSGSFYEPDFVLFNEKDNKNIFIDVEIDEPYDGFTRIPIHCIGEDNLRDEFFTNRGWIVIRFAEIQVHLEPKKCCSLIAKVIHSIDTTFKSELLNEEDPSLIIQWDSLQANKWAFQKYREKYLEIENFGRRPNVSFMYTIAESEADKIVEREVPMRKEIVTEARGILAVNNRDDRDKRIIFDSIEHRYFIDGNIDTISVTQLVDKFFPEFDTPHWAALKAEERGISTEDIIAEWEDNGIGSAEKGTALHEEIENYYNNKSYNSNTPEFQHFLSFKQRFSNMTPFRSEWRIFDEDLLVAGTIDMVYKKEDGSLYMFDWKRSKKIVRSDGSIINDTYKFAFGELNHLGDNSYNRYCLQQNIYRAILEKRYYKKISSMNLLVLHESFKRYHLIQIPKMDKEVNYIFGARLLKI